MRNVQLNIYDPGDILATTAKDGSVTLWSVDDDGTLITSKRIYDKILAETQDIEDLCLTVRSYNILKREGINTVGDLARFYETSGDKGLTDFRNMTKSHVEEIVHALQSTHIITE